MSHLDLRSRASSPPSLPKEYKKWCGRNGSKFRSSVINENDLKADLIKPFLDAQQDALSHCENIHRSMWEKTVRLSEDMTFEERTIIQKDLDEMRRSVCVEVSKSFAKAMEERDSFFTLVSTPELRTKTEENVRESVLFAPDDKMISLLLSHEGGEEGGEMKVSEESQSRGEGKGSGIGKEKGKEKKVKEKEGETNLGSPGHTRERIKSKKSGKLNQLFHPIRAKLARLDVEWMNAVVMSPNDHDLITNHLRTMFQNTKHVLGKLMETYTNELFDRVMSDEGKDFGEKDVEVKSPLSKKRKGKGKAGKNRRERNRNGLVVDERQFNAEIQSLKELIAELERAVYLTYRPLILGLEAQDSDCNSLVINFGALTRSVVEEILLFSSCHIPPAMNGATLCDLWLKPAYLDRYGEANRHTAHCIMQVLTCNPSHLGIKKRFWLLPTPAQAIEVDDPPPPYQSAIDCLELLPTAKGTSGKIKCLTNTLSLISQCVFEHWEGAKDKRKLILGADDLFPIFAYCVVKANVPDVFCEAAFLFDLAPDYCFVGKEGYALVTFQASLQFIESASLTALMRDALESLMRHDSFFFSQDKNGEVFWDVKEDNSSFEQAEDWMFDETIAEENPKAPSLKKEAGKKGKKKKKKGGKGLKKGSEGEVFQKTPRRLIVEEASKQNAVLKEASEGTQKREQAEKDKVKENKEGSPREIGKEKTRQEEKVIAGGREERKEVQIAITKEKKPEWMRFSSNVGEVIPSEVDAVKIYVEKPRKQTVLRFNPNQEREGGHPLSPPSRENLSPSSPSPPSPPPSLSTFSSFSPSSLSPSSFSPAPLSPPSKIPYYCVSPRLQSNSEPPPSIPLFSARSQSTSCIVGPRSPQLTDQSLRLDHPPGLSSDSPSLSPEFVRSHVVSPQLPQNGSSISASISDSSKYYVPPSQPQQAPQQAPPQAKKSRRTKNYTFAAPASSSVSPSAASYPSNILSNPSQQQQMSTPSAGLSRVVLAPVYYFTEPYPSSSQGTCIELDPIVSNSTPHSPSFLS